MYKIIWRSIIAVAAILFAGVLILQLPQVQTFLVGKVTDSLSKKLDGEIVFEKLHIRPFTTLVLKNVAIIDKNPVKDPTAPEKEVVDTFFRAKYIIARFSLEGLRDPNGIHIRKAYVADASMHLGCRCGKDPQLHMLRL